MSYTVCMGSSLHSKRFCLVSEQRKTEEGDFRFWLRKLWNESQKMKEEDGKGKEGRKPSFLPHPARLLTCPIFHIVFDPHFSFIALKVHRTLATQAIQARTQKISTNKHPIKLSNVESLQLSFRVNQH